MIPVETELKWQLSPAGHAELQRRIGAMLGEPRVLEQDNRFFDSTDGRLRAARRSVRLRRENGRIILTCKAKGSVDDLGTHRHDEWERELAADAWDVVPTALPEAWAAVLAGAPLVAFAGFANVRLEWHDGLHLLCLDRSDFGVCIDHELEIETSQPQAAHARWGALLTDWGITWTPQPATKLHRCVGLRTTPRP